MTQVMGMTASACKSDQSSEPPNRFKSELGEEEISAEGSFLIVIFF
jgi:hypothetical protein